VNVTRKPQHQEEILKKLREDYDQLRHADRHPHRDIKINELIIELFLDCATRSLHLLTGEATDEARIYNAWFRLKYPHLFKEEAGKKLGPLPPELTKQEFHKEAIQLIVDESQSR
jgi:hypothetical protein